MAANDVDTTIPSSLTDCIYFLNGYCKRGNACRYRHCRTAIPSSLIDCLYFLNGYCKWGNTCRYRHCRAAGEQTKNCYKWPNSCKKTECPYRHPSILQKESSSSLEQVKQRQEGVIALFWDLENVPIPRTERPFDIVQRLRQELILTPCLSEVVFNCYCDTNTIPQEKLLGLHHANVRIVHVPDRKSAGTDRQILLDLDRFGHDHRPPGTIVLISGDIDFVSKLSDLRHRVGFRVIVVHNISAKEELKATANVHYRWDRYISSTEKTYPDHSNQRVPASLVASSKHQCPLCLKNNFSSLEALRMHQNSKQHFVDCPHCDDRFLTVESQQEHHHVKHLIDRGRRLNVFKGKHLRQKSKLLGQGVAECFTCPQCSAGNFTSMTALRQHQEAKSHLYDCPECDDSYFTSHEQQQHQLEDHTSFEEKITCKNRRRKRTK